MVNSVESDPKFRIDTLMLDLIAQTGEKLL